jgi:hypothetical protein
MYITSPKSFIEKLFCQRGFNDLQHWNIIPDQQYIIHIKDQKYNCAPTNLLVNIRFFYVLNEAKPFGYFIKT